MDRAGATGSRVALAVGRQPVTRRDSPETPPLSEYAESALTLAAISPLLLGLTALLALPVGVVGLVEVRRSRGRLRGTGHAIAAIIISLVVLASVTGLAFYVVGNPFPGACEECQPQAMGACATGGTLCAQLRSSHV